MAFTSDLLDHFPSYVSTSDDYPRSSAHDISRDPDLNLVISRRVLLTAIVVRTTL